MPLEELRNLSDLTTDGNTLVNQCFDGNNPLIVMNKLSTDDEKSEHKGLQTLLNAIVYLYRNPKAHHLKYFCDDTYQSTLEALIIIQGHAMHWESVFGIMPDTGGFRTRTVAINPVTSSMRCSTVPAYDSAENSLKNNMLSMILRDRLPLKSVM